MPEIEATAHARQARQNCEAEILALLKQLCADTGLDLDRVHVLTLVTPAGDDDEPQVVPYAVKVVLGV